MCFAIICLYLTGKKLFSSSNGLALCLFLSSIALPKKTAISIFCSVLPSNKILHRLDLAMPLLIANFVLFTLPSLANSASYSCIIFIFSFFSSVFLFRIGFDRHDWCLWWLTMKKGSEEKLWSRLQRLWVRKNCLHKEWFCPSWQQNILLWTHIDELFIRTLGDSLVRTLMEKKMCVISRQKNIEKSQFGRKKMYVIPNVRYTKCTLS